MFSTDLRERHNEGIEITISFEEEHNTIIITEWTKYGPELNLWLNLTKLMLFEWDFKWISSVSD